MKSNRFPAWTSVELFFTLCMLVSAAFNVLSSEIVVRLKLTESQLGSLAELASLPSLQASSCRGRTDRDDANGLWLGAVGYPEILVLDTAFERLVSAMDALVGSSARADSFLRVALAPAPEMGVSGCRYRALRAFANKPCRASLFNQVGKFCLYRMARRFGIETVLFIYRIDASFTGIDFVASIFAEPSFLHQAKSRSFSLTTRTGHGARRTISSAVLPLKARFNPV